MADQQFCLRWNNHQSTLISVFDTLLENGTLVDCTLAAEGQYLKAHKVVLCACSPYLETLLSQHYEKHPIVILKDVKFSELKSMMDYMYRGEVNISQDQLGTFLKAAESLQIKGLSDNGADGDARDVGSTPKAPPPRKATQPAPSSRPEPSRPDSPLTDGSMSPSSRKRRRVRRSSQEDGDSHLDSNSCDLPSQAQSTPVPNIPVASSSITTTTIVKPAIVKPEQTDVNRIETNSLPPEALKKEIEPINEPLLEPKTEYLEDVNNEDSVEDLTLDDDDDMDGMDISNMSNMSNMSRPGPSHGNDISNQGFAPWQLGANQSGTDEVFMAAQEAVNQHRDSQGCVDIKTKKKNQTVPHHKKEEFGKKNFPRKDEFKKQLFQFANKLTSIVNTTNHRFSESTVINEDVVDVDSDSDVEFVPVSETLGDDSCFIAEPAPDDLEFQPIEDNVVIIDQTEANVGLEVDPLSSSGEIYIKQEPMEIKIEHVYNFTPAVHGENLMSQRKETQVPLFRCDLCPYTSKHNNVIGQHKWRVHQIKGKKNCSNISEIEVSTRSKTSDLFKCDLCPFASKLNKALKIHKYRAHNMKKKMNLPRKTWNTKSLNPPTTGIKVEQLDEENTIVEDPEVKQSHVSTSVVGTSELKKCPHCPFETRFNAALAIHKKRMHFVRPEKNVKKTFAPIWKRCPHCPFTTKFSSALVLHKKKHKESNVGTKGSKKNCPHCSFKTYSGTALSMHFKAKHFIQPEIAHRTNAEGRYECEDCKCSYLHYHNLLRHIKTHHVHKAKRKCPYCEEIVFFEFRLCKHIERKHPDKWNELKRREFLNLQDEGIQNAEETESCVQIKKEPSSSNEATSNKHSCQLCPFQTEDFHILGLHKQVVHSKRKQYGQDKKVELKCLFCGTKFPYRSIMVKHVQRKHPGAWLKLGRSAKQSELRFKDQAQTSTPNVMLPGTSHTNQPKQRMRASTSTPDYLSESNNSNSSWRDIKVEEEEQTRVVKKYCKLCSRFYNPDFYKYHACKGLLQCDLCSKSVSLAKMNYHKYKIHGIIPVGKHNINTNATEQESETQIVKGIGKSGNSLKEQTDLDTVSTGRSSISELNDEEYVPTTSTKKRVYKLDGPRETCKQCKKSFHKTYLKYHRCYPLLKCNCCSYTNTSMNKLKLHLRLHYQNLQNKTVSKSKQSVDERKPDYKKVAYDEPKEETTFETDLNQESTYKPSTNNESLEANNGGDIYFCEQCNSNHDARQFWKYVCYKQRKIRCKMCSFVSSSKAYMEKHMRKQHSTRKNVVGKVQSRHKLKCKFCPLMFKNSDHLNKHLNLKHVEDRVKAKTTSSQDQEVKSSDQPKSTPMSDTKRVKKFADNQSWDSGSDIYEASTSTAPEKSLTAQQIVKRACTYCCKSYNPAYFPYHRCSLVKESRMFVGPDGNGSPSSTITSEESRPLSVSAERVKTPAVVVEDDESESQTALDKSLPSTSEGTTKESTLSLNLAKGLSEVVEDRLNCETCQMCFTTSTFQGHNCRPFLNCQKCTFRTRLKAQMALHDKKHLMDDLVLTEESLYQCKICKKKFASESWFRHHKLNECKRKLFHQCSLCRKKFHQEKNLKLHMLQLHSGRDGKGPDEEKKDNERSLLNESAVEEEKDNENKNELAVEEEEDNEKKDNLVGFPAEEKNYSERMKKLPVPAFGEERNNDFDLTVENKKENERINRPTFITVEEENNYVDESESLNCTVEEAKVNDKSN